MRRKKVIACMLLLSMTVCLMACGKNEQETRQIGSTDQTAVTEESTPSDPQPAESTEPTLTVSSEPTGQPEPTGGSSPSLIIPDGASNQQMPTGSTQPTGTEPAGTQPTGTQPTDGSQPTTPSGGETTDGSVVVDVAWQYDVLTYVVDKTHWCIHRPNCSCYNPEDDLQTVSSTLRGLVDLNQLNVCQECLGPNCSHREEPWEYEIAYYTVDMDTHRIHRTDCENINLDNYTRTVRSSFHTLMMRNYLFPCPDCFADPTPEDQGEGSG